MLSSAITVYADDEVLNLYIQNEEEARELIANTTMKLKGDYHGYCGQYVHDTLVKTGILRKNSYAYNGKDWFASYKKGSSGNRLQDGWTYDCYEGKDALKEILEKYNGKVYNLLFSMNSGSKYGHAFFVNAIIDDTVYFTESFGSSYFGTKQKQLIVLDLEDFIDYYINSNYFIASKGGIIHFYEEGFYPPIISFEGNESVSSDYVYDYVNNNNTMTDMMYNDIVLENILYQDNLYMEQVLQQNYLDIWFNVKNVFSL
jgi:hypothetical protein